MPILTNKPLEDSDDEFDLFDKTSEKSVSTVANSESLSESDENKSVSFIKLKDDAKTEIVNVYHMADIHIRNTERHAEYLEVFDRTYKLLKAQIGTNKKTSLIVLAGDIVHAKTELSPEAVHFVRQFIEELCKITSVIIIQGNHDRNMSNPKRMDALTPVIDVLEDRYPVYYLKTTGIYQYQNIIFGVTGIMDNTLLDASKISKEIWNSVKQKNKYKISLFHGTVHGCKTDVGYRMNNEQILAEHFDGYDYVFLGDTHRHQYLNLEKTIAYSGSLIQQDFGESLNNHGVLKWDLTDGESTLLEVNNDYGFCTIKIVDGKMVDTKIPRKPRIMFDLQNTTHLQYLDVRKHLENNYQVVLFVKESNFRTKLHKNNKKTNKNSESKQLSQENIIKEYLIKKDVEAEKVDDIIDLHQILCKKVHKGQMVKIKNKPVLNDTINGQKWSLLELHFTNTLSYGKDNVIDFRKYDANKIIGIHAPNHYGKSAILDIILFCLFDKLSRGDRRDILNKNEKRMFCSLLFSIGCKQYLIERIGERSKNGLSVKVDVNFYCFTLDENGIEQKEKLNGLDKNDTNRKICELVGDYNDYLTTCFCLQNGYHQGKTSNFIDMTQLQKKEYLNETLKLNIFEKCFSYAKEKLKEFSVQLKFIETRVINKDLDETKDKIKELKNKIRILKSREKHLNENLIGLIDNCIEMCIPPKLMEYDELSSYQLNDLEDIDNTINKIKEKLSEKVDIDIDVLLKELENTSKILADLESEKEGKMFQKKLADLMNEKNKLSSEIVGIPTDHSKVKILIMKKEKVTIEENINGLTSEIAKFDKTNFTQCEDKTVLKAKLNTLRQGIRETKNIKLDNISLSAELEDLTGKYLEELDSPIFNVKLSRDKKLILENSILVKKQFVEELTNISTELIPIDNIDKVKKLNNEYIAKYTKWISSKELILSKQENNHIIENFFTCMDKVSEKISEYLENTINIEHNKKINKEIATLDAELDKVMEQQHRKQTYQNLEVELALMEKQLKLINESIILHEKYESSQENNRLLTEKIENLQTDIDNINIEEEKITNKINSVKIELKKLKTKKDMYQNKIEERKQYKMHLRLLQKYYYNYAIWKENTDETNYWVNFKRKITDELVKISAQSEIHQNEINILNKEVETYFENRKEFDDLSKKLELYQLYTQVMNANGLPYEILKTYLPIIEADVNEILHSMVNFNVEFVVFDEELIEDQKAKKIKTNVGCIDLNICRDGLKPCNVQLACGFERFIIGLAIRMTLCQISLKSKPNFLIIDEGWSSLDSDNMNNIGAIMAYIKTQYEHVITITHLEELKNQSDYIINIDMEKGYSYIRECRKVSKLKSGDKKLKIEN